MELGVRAFGSSLAHEGGPLIDGIGVLTKARWLLLQEEDPGRRQVSVNQKGSPYQTPRLPGP